MTEKDGFGIIDAMVAMVLMSMVAIGATVVTRNSMKGQNNVKTSADIDNAIALIKLRMSNGCDAMLASTASPFNSIAAGATSASFNFNPGSLPPMAATLAQPITFSGIFAGITTAAGPTYSGTLRLSLTKPGQVMGAATVERDIPLLVTIDSTSRNVIACTNAAVSADDLSVRSQVCADLGGTFDPDAAPSPACSLTPVTIPNPPLQIFPPAATVKATEVIPFGAYGGVYPYTYSVVSGQGTLLGNTLTLTNTSDTVVVQVTDKVGSKSTAKVIVSAVSYTCSCSVGCSGGGTQTPNMNMDGCTGTGSTVNCSTNKNSVKCWGSKGKNSTCFACNGPN